MDRRIGSGSAFGRHFSVAKCSKNRIDRHLTIWGVTPNPVLQNRGLQVRVLPLLPIKSITSGQASGGGSENLKLLADMPLSSAQLFKDGEIVRDHPFGRKLRNALTRLVR